MHLLYNKDRDNEKVRVDNNVKVQKTILMILHVTFLGKAMTSNDWLISHSILIVTLDLTSKSIKTYCIYIFIHSRRAAYQIVFTSCDSVLIIFLSWFVYLKRSKRYVRS